MPSGCDGRADCVILEPVSASYWTSGTLTGDQRADLLSKGSRQRGTDDDNEW